MSDIEWVVGKEFEYRVTDEEILELRVDLKQNRERPSHTFKSLLIASAGSGLRLQQHNKLRDETLKFFVTLPRKLSEDGDTYEE